MPTGRPATAPASEPRYLRSARALYRYFKARGLASRTNPKPGDLVIWGYGSHVGIYIGNGKAISTLMNGVRDPPRPRGHRPVHGISPHGDVDQAGELSHAPPARRRAAAARRLEDPVARPAIGVFAHPSRRSTSSRQARMASAERSMSAGGRLPARHREAHRRPTGPRRPTQPARPVALDGVDDRPGPGVAEGPVGVVARRVEPDEDLVEHDVVEDPDAGSGRQPLGHLAGERAVALDQLDQARPARATGARRGPRTREPVATIPGPSCRGRARRPRSRCSRPRRGSSPGGAPPRRGRRRAPSRTGTLSHLCASVDHESAAARPRMRWRSDGTAAAQIPNAPSTWTHAPRCVRDRRRARRADRTPRCSRCRPGRRR